MSEILKRLSVFTLIGGLYGGFVGFFSGFVLGLIGIESFFEFWQGIKKVSPVFVGFGFVLGSVTSLICFSFVVGKTKHIPIKNINKYIGIPVFLVMLVLMSIPLLNIILFTTKLWFVIAVMTFIISYSRLKKEFPEAEKEAE